MYIFNPLQVHVHRVLLCSYRLLSSLDVHHQLHSLLALERVLGTGRKGLPWGAAGKGLPRGVISKSGIEKIETSKIIKFHQFFRASVILNLAFHAWNHAGNHPKSGSHHVSTGSSKACFNHHNWELKPPMRFSANPRLSTVESGLDSI